jgi:hypothetical protein
MRRSMVCLVLLALVAATFAARGDGVEPDEIRVVLYNGWGVEGDMNDPIVPTDSAAERSMKRYRERLAETTDTYGRTVHVFAFQGRTSSGGCAQGQMEADLIAERYQPFAVAFLRIIEPRCTIARLADKFGVLSFVLNEGLTKDTFSGYAPHVWGFFPDRALDARVSASFVCRTLAGGVARPPFTKDPALVGDTRSFAIIAETGDHRATLLARKLARCGIELKPIRFGDGSRTVTDHALASREAVLIMRDLKSKGITTLICYCASSDVSLAVMEQAATAIGYMPEWYWDDATSLSTLENHRSRSTWLGISHWWQQPTKDGAATYPSMADFEIYTSLWMMFTAFHRAGPDLSVETVEAGLSTLVNRPADNPFVPGGGFDDENLSPYTYVDTALMWWNDPTGTPPGGRNGEGCFRVGNDDRRYTVGSWPKGDEWLGTSDAPCAQLKPR